MSVLKERYEAFTRARISETINYDTFNAFLLTHHSTRMEGSTLTELDTRLLLEKGITPKKTIGAFQHSEKSLALTKKVLENLPRTFFT